VLCHFEIEKTIQKEKRNQGVDGKKMGTKSLGSLDTTYVLHKYVNMYVVGTYLHWD
jgi:hypothetical protein